MSTEDHRRHPRASIKQIVPLSCSTCSGDTAAVTQDISLGGVLLRTSSCVGEGAEVAVSLIMPLQISRTREVHVLCRGKVLRRTEQARAANIAIEFYDSEPFRQ